MTTHSPHIVSVSPLNSLVLLRKSSDGTSTEGVSTASVQFEETDERDLERYLDVTRGEMLFAKGILLVEGDAELYLIPALGKCLGFDFDELGITVCSVSGTNFAPYVKLLGPSALAMPFAVITDFDPVDGGGSLGQSRIVRLMKGLLDAKALAGKSDIDLLKLAPKHGLFLNEHTLEVDLFKCRPKGVTNTLMDLAESKVAKERAAAWQADPKTLDAKRLIADITAIGKGRFAQRLASRLATSKCPPYISEAIEYVAKRCR